METRLQITLVAVGLLALTCFSLHHTFGSVRPGPEGHGGWYIHPEKSVFQALGAKHETDKVSVHNYQTMYGRIFELQQGRPRTKKLLEIGLGCFMAYGPGHSAKIWREYLPHAEIWMAEYDANCVKKYQGYLDGLRIKALTGDQGDIPTLERWVQETGGNFDVIVDDGGHSNMQQFNSFMVLFAKALKPGGIYVIEDLNASRLPQFQDGDKQHIMLGIIKEWIEDLVMSPDQGGKLSIRYPRPQSIKSIECSSHACSVVKRYEDDPYTA